MERYNPERPISKGMLKTMNDEKLLSTLSFMKNEFEKILKDNDVTEDSLENELN